MSSELSQVITTINTEINEIIERNLLPHFETIRIIGTLLKQLPEFKRLEQENADLKKQLNAVVDKAPQVQAPPVQAWKEQVLQVQAEPVQANEIKLNIVETQLFNIPVVSESDLYKTVNLSINVNNKLQTDEEEEEEEEVVEEEEDTLEEEEEDGVEGAEPLEEEEDGDEGAEPLEEEEEVDEEEEEEEEEEVVEEEEEEVDEDGVEGAEPLEDGVEGAEPLEEPLDEEVFIIEIKGKGKFYTNNETNGDIYQIEGEDDVGDQVGKFINKVATFIKA